MPISELADKPARIENRLRLIDDGAGGVTEQTVKFPIWFEPEGQRQDADERRVRGRRTCGVELHPVEPGVVPADRAEPDRRQAERRQPAERRPNRISKLATTDGSALVFNLLIASDPKPPMYFLDDESLLVDIVLRSCSSGCRAMLPPKLSPRPERMASRSRTGARGVVFNADLVAVVRFLDIGTRVTTRLN